MKSERQIMFENGTCWSCIYWNGFDLCCERDGQCDPIDKSLDKEKGAWSLDKEKGA